MKKLFPKLKIFHFSYIMQKSLVTLPQNEETFTLAKNYLQIEFINLYYYYSFKIFSRFSLAKSTRLIRHNQLLMTKFGRILTLTRK